MYCSYAICYQTCVFIELITKLHTQLSKIICLCSYFCKHHQYTATNCMNIKKKLNLRQGLLSIPTSYIFKMLEAIFFNFHILLWLLINKN